MAIVKKYEAKSAEWLVAKKAETEEMIKASQNIMTKVEEQALKAREQKAGNPEGGEEIKKEEKEWNLNKVKSNEIKIDIA